jgi:hypothetical protein
MLGPQCSYFGQRVAQAGDVYQKQIKTNLERKKQKQTRLAWLRNGTDPDHLQEAVLGSSKESFLFVCFINLTINIFFSH